MSIAKFLRRAGLALAVAALAATPALAAEGHWRFVDTAIKPTPAETAAIKPPPGRIHEVRVTGAFQPEYGGRGTVELFMKADDVDHRVYESRVTFTFGASSDMRVLIPGSVLKFDGHTTLKSNWPGAAGTGSVTVDNSDYVVDTKAGLAGDPKPRGEYKVPAGAPGAAMTLFGAAHLSAYGGLSGHIAVRYEWVAGPAPVLTPPQPQADANDLSGRWTGTWTNDLGERGATQLNVTRAPDGSLTGVWDGMAIAAVQVGPGGQFRFQARSANRAYRIEGTVRGGVIALRYTATRLDGTGHYSGAATLRRAASQ